MSAQEKYQSLLELANQNGTTYELSQNGDTLVVTGTAPSEAAKQQLWDEYNRIDPDYKSGDLILNISTGNAAGGGNTYTVESGDSLSKIAKAEYGNANDWPRIFEANKDVLKDPNKIFPGQKLKIPPK